MSAIAESPSPALSLARPALVPAILIAAGGSHFLNDLLQSLLTSIYPLLKANFSLSFTEIGLISLVFQLTGPDNWTVLPPSMRDPIFADKRVRQAASSEINPLERRHLNRRINQCFVTARLVAAKAGAVGGYGRERSSDLPVC